MEALKISPSLASRCAALALALLPSGLCAAPPQFSVTIIAPAGVGAFSGSGINNLGQIAGYVPGPPFPVTAPAFRVDGSTATPLGTFGGNDYQTTGINAAGQIAGSYFPGGLGSTRGVRWTGTTPSILLSLGGTASGGYGINTSGQVTGWATTRGDAAFRAVRWNAGAPTDLGTLGGESSEGLGINDAGQVAGRSQITVGVSTTHAVRWTGTTAQDLGTLVGGTNSTAYAINTSGQVAGISEYGPGPETHAVRWDGTTATDLGTLGGTTSLASAINVWGDILGMSTLAGGAPFSTAFLYSEGAMYDLRSLLDPGTGIVRLNVDFPGNTLNDLGQIVARADFVGGGTQVVRLDPTPEPGSALLLLGGAALLGLGRRR